MIKHTVTVYGPRNKIESVSHFDTQDAALDYLETLHDKKAEYKNEFVLKMFARNKKGVDIRF